MLRMNGLNKRLATFSTESARRLQGAHRNSGSSAGPYNGLAFDSDIGHRLRLRLGMNSSCSSCLVNDLLHPL